MNWVYTIVVYVVTWWLVLFMVLPVGVKTAEEAGEELEAGHDPGAPVRPMLWRKVLATTVISAVVVGIIVLIQRYDLISFRVAGS